MKNEMESLSVGTKVKHRAMTKMFRRRAQRMSQHTLKRIFRECDVSPRIGCLPKTLRQRVPANALSEVTEHFFNVLDSFVAKNKKSLTRYQNVAQYSLDDMAALFGTPCIVYIRNGADGGRAWVGATSNVFKLSFPEIGAEYAIKLFNGIGTFSHHGAWHEIPDAFAASCAEPKDNVRVHMASLGVNKYLISDWMGDEESASDNFVRANKHEMFFTDPAEERPDNWRHGKRIDFGKTYLSFYGRAPYRVRKMYRAIINANQRYGIHGIDGIVADATTKDAKHDLQAAAKILQFNGRRNISALLADSINRIQK